MTTDNKIKLTMLLAEYMNEKADENRKYTRDEWGHVIPTKALYTHARILHRKLCVEVENELKSIYQS